MLTLPNGVFPAMITPFTKDNEIDYPAVGRFLDYFRDCGCAGVFSVCASSEMDLLSLEERVSLASYISKNKKDLKVVCSGHIGKTFDEQVTEINAMSETGIDAIILITARLNAPDLDDAGFIANTEHLIGSIKNTDISYGFYERPIENCRRLTPEVIKHFADTGKFVFLKDTECQVEPMAKKCAAAKGSNFKLYNANSTFLYDTLLNGASGFSGNMSNIHCDLYCWLCENFEKYPKEAAYVSDFIGAMSQNGQQYPAIAKYHQQRYGAYMETYSRLITVPLREENKKRIEQMENLCNELRQTLKNLK